MYKDHSSINTKLNTIIQKSPKKKGDRRKLKVRIRDQKLVYRLILNTEPKET